jgi:hypothetical protein
MRAGILIRAGPQGPRCPDAVPAQADEEAGRRPGGPPHKKIAGYRNTGFTRRPSFRLSSVGSATASPSFTPCVRATRVMLDAPVCAARQ